MRISQASLRTSATLHLRSSDAMAFASATTGGGGPPPLSLAEGSVGLVTSGDVDAHAPGTGTAPSANGHGVLAQPSSLSGSERATHGSERGALPAAAGPTSILAQARVLGPEQPALDVGPPMERTMSTPAAAQATLSSGPALRAVTSVPPQPHTQPSAGHPSTPGSTTAAPSSGGWGAPPGPPGPGTALTTVPSISPAAMAALAALPPRLRHEFVSQPEAVQRRIAGLLRMHVLGSVRVRVEAGHLDYINEIRPLTCMFLGFPSLTEPSDTASHKDQVASVQFAYTTVQVRDGGGGRRGLWRALVGWGRAARARGAEAEGGRVWRPAEGRASGAVGCVRLG